MATKTAPAPKVKVTPRNAQRDVTRELEALFRDGVLVDLDIGFWTARKRNDASDLGIEDEEQIPDFVVGLGTKRLLPKEMTDEWQQIAAHARTRLRKWSHLFPIGNASFVPLEALPKIEEMLLEDQAKFYSVVKEKLLDRWDDVRAKLLADYPEHADKLSRVFPNKHEVERMFYFSWASFTVSLPKKISKAGIDARMAQKKVDAETAALARYNAEIESRLDGFLNDTVTALRARVIKVCASISERVKAGDVVTNKNLTTLRNCVEQFKTMGNFLGDADVLARLEKVQKELLGENTADDFADNARLRTQLQQALDDVARAADATDVSEVTGEYRRRMIL